MPALWEAAGAVRRVNCWSPKDTAVSTKHPCLGENCADPQWNAQSAGCAFLCKTMPSRGHYRLRRLGGGNNNRSLLGIADREWHNETMKPSPDSKHPEFLPVLGRRQIMGALAAVGAAVFLKPSAFAQTGPLLTRPIPSTGEALPVVGLGSWITFNVGSDRVARDACAEVLRNFFDAGGRMVDSSPMYGSSQDVIGYGLNKLGKPQRAFSADKVWISSGSAGRAQIEKSRQRWGVSRFDLVAVHNLLSWQEHLPTLFAMKAAGEIRYVGVTTSEGRRHQEIEEIMRRQPLDFVQVSYSAVERDVEARILPLARDRGIAVVANRPFREGALIRAVKRQPLPPWASEADCANWAEFLLKFIVSHPAVVCAIPATTRVAHVRENMGACLGRLPDEAMRRRMAAHVEQF